MKLKINENTDTLYWELKSDINTSIDKIMNKYAKRFGISSGDVPPKYEISMQESIEKLVNDIENIIYMQENDWKENWD